MRDEMTRRERLLAAHRGEPVDRPPIKIWGADPWTQVIHPSFQPILDAALEKTDLVASWGIGVNMFYTRPEVIDGKIRTKRRPSRHENYEEVHTWIDTPKGQLHTTFLVGTRVGLPGYTEEYMFKTPEDVEKWLSIPYEPPYDESGRDCDSFFGRDKEMGDRGIVMVGFEHPMYMFQSKAGSENFALWSVQCRDVIYAFLDEILKRQLDYVRHIIRAGCGPVWGYVGPELCVPPLMSPADFDEFVVRYDRKLTDEIHAAGNVVWCHSHGNMNKVLEKFIDLGADVLNPVEPPPWGDIELKEARERVGERLTLEGNIEKDQLFRAPEDEIRAQVRAALTDGPLTDGRRFILCPSAGFMEHTTCSDTLLHNFLAYIDEAHKCCEERVWEG